MTSTTEARPRWISAVASAVAAVVVAGMIHLLSSEVTWRSVVMFTLAGALIATAMFVALRSVRVAVAVLIGAAAVFAGRAFLSFGLINVLDVGLLAADDVVGPFIGTWIASFILMSALIGALEARRKIWLIALLTVIAVVSIPTRFPALA